MRRAVVVACSLLASWTSLLAAEEAKTPPDFRLAKVRVLPKAGAAGSLAGLRIVGSNTNATNGFVELATVPDLKGGGDVAGWVEMAVKAQEVYRFIKIEAGNEKLALAEIEFYSAAGRLKGKGFGTSGGKDDQKAFEAALDGDVKTSFVAPIDHAYVGIELGGEAVTGAVWFEPPAGAYDKPVKVNLHMWPPGPTVRYTTDGSTPSREHGEVFKEKLNVEKTTSIAAISFQEGKADGPLLVRTYVIGAEGQLPREVKTYHIGNSLTDTTKGSFDAIAMSGGRNVRTFYKTIPGCSLGGNWTSKGQGFGYPEAWANDYERVAQQKLDHLFLQPFPNPPGLKHDTDSGVNFIKLARQYNPDVQPWLYAQWISYPAIDAGGKVVAAYCDQIGGQSWWKSEPEAWYPPIAKKDVKSWEDAMTNTMAYYRTILKRWNEAAPGGKPARLMPGGPVLLRLKKAIEAGELPGVSDFGAFAFSDPIHLTPGGAYAVSLAHYACVFGESPEGKVTWATSRLTEQQAKVLQKIAWEVVTADPDSGVRR